MMPCSEKPVTSNDVLAQTYDALQKVNKEELTDHRAQITEHRTQHVAQAEHRPEHVQAQSVEHVQHRAQTRARSTEHTQEHATKRGLERAFITPTGLTKDETKYESPCAT